MVALKVPDRLSILTYVSQYYNYFHGRSPIGGMGGIKRPADLPVDEPSGKKNQPVVSKLFPSSNPAREKSPPPSSNITRPPPSPKQPRISTQDAVVEKSHQTGTLSNKCVSCNKHVHLVQRHLVDGKLYHRNCAKLLTPTNTSSALRNLSTNTPVSKFTPLSDSSKTITTPTDTPSRQGPTWQTEKLSTPPSVSSSSPFRPPSGVSSSAKESPAASRGTAFPTTTCVSTMSTATTQTSATVAKTRESKLKFLQSDNTSTNEEKKTTSITVDINKGQTVSGRTQGATADQPVPVVVNVGGMRRKEVNGRLDKGGDGAKTSGAGGKVSSKQEADEINKKKASAADFLSKKLAEENNNNRKPQWTTVALKKTDRPQPQVETPKKETERVRVKLRADRSILDDLKTPDPPTPAPTPAVRSGLSAKTPDRGGPKPGSASPNTSVSENESPADWRSRLKPVCKETKPAAPSQSSPKTWTNSAENTSEPSVGPSSSSSNSVTSLASKGFQNGQKEQTANGNNSESKTKTKPDYIPKEDIMKELQEIEDNLNELEQRGVELEMKLRKSEEEGDDDTLMDELMVEWFNLIRNKQVAMRRESELVYIGRTQDLEEQQPSVEQELRRLLDKPDHLKTPWDKKKQEQLMEKLLEIINDRNAIVEGLDEDRLREEEEDEQLNKMMMNFNIKKDKQPKRKSLFSKLFSK
ncbi:protein-methionine sulfoxide oxidase mical2b isoform X2 [Parambassis ranga]|nr:MICAL-like protein 2 isoform X2 [Parambassis ranga]